MMDFISVPVVIGIITLGIYKLFELFVRRQERIMLVERMKEGSVSPMLPPIPQSSTSFTALKLGCLLAGLGLGLLLGYLICGSTMDFYHGGDFNWEQRRMVEIIFGACVLCMGGLGLVIAFIIELKLSKKQ